jgi:phosphoribosyl-AMP cyclohydrolase
LSIDEIAAFVSRIQFDQGSVPAVVQDAETREVRMVGLMSREALEMTLSSGEAHFHSRSRGRAWKKGATSGAVQRVRSVWLDCGNNAVLLEVEQVGDVTCHRGDRTCFQHVMRVLPGEATVVEAPHTLPLVQGPPSPGRRTLLQQPLDSLSLETHVRPLLAAYASMLDLDRTSADAARDVREHLSSSARALAAVAADANQAVEAAAQVWSWCAVSLILHSSGSEEANSVDAAAPALSIARGYFAPRQETAALLPGLQAAADNEQEALRVLEVLGSLMRAHDLRPYAFLDVDRRQMLTRPFPRLSGDDTLSSGIKLNDS